MFPCRRIEAGAISRRQMLARSALGFGAVAAAAMLAQDGVGAALADTPLADTPLNASSGQSGSSSASERDAWAPRPPHFEPRAKSVILLYMDGGPSQVDTFDPKPRLTREHGRPFGMKMEPTQFNNNGNALGSFWKFQQHGQSGIPVSELFPYVAQHVDRLAVIRSMTSKFSEHTNANSFLHTGNGQPGRPSMGAWVGYGLGSENRTLPGFVVLNGGLIPPGGLDNFSSGFLPASYQGSLFRPDDPPLANVKRQELTSALQQNKLALMKRLDAGLAQRASHDDQIETAIANYELAYRMQAAVPELTELSGETRQTRAMYGLESSFQPTAIFGRQCLLARRMVERGVRFIELTCPSVGSDRWDQHTDLESGHKKNAKAVDQPIGALLGDLAQRGLLDQTLVVWGGEFGRTPFAQGSNGRDHNPFAFSIWLAGGGVKGGVIHGETDDYGYKVVADKCEIHDLHATMLHLLGVDHKRSTFRFGGRDMRLTDVHGELIKPILA